MSAFVVSKAHIDAMISAGLVMMVIDGGDPVRWFHPPLKTGSPHEVQSKARYLTAHTAGMVGAMLWAENVRSVNHRYSEDEIEQPYLFEPHEAPIPPVAILRAIDTYEYQSCETPGWHTSQAKAFCDALRRRVIACLPGYEEAPGHIREHQPPPMVG